MYKAQQVPATLTNSSLHVTADPAGRNINGSLPSLRWAKVEHLVIQGTEQSRQTPYPERFVQLLHLGGPSCLRNLFMEAGLFQAFHCPVTQTTLLPGAKGLSTRAHTFHVTTSVII